MVKSKDQPKYTEVKFTEAERKAFRMLHSLGLHESIEFSEQCDMNTLFYVNDNVVRMVMHPDYRDEMSEDELRARALMVANTRVLEKSIGLCDSVITISASGKELMDEMVRAMAKLVCMNITHNYREYKPVTLHVSSKGMDYAQDYRVDPKLLVSDPMDLMATMTVRIKEDFNEYLRRTKD